MYKLRSRQDDEGNCTYQADLQQTHPANGASNRPLEKRRRELQKAGEEKQCRVLQCDLADRILLFFLISIMTRSRDQKKTLHQVKSSPKKGVKYHISRLKSHYFCILLGMPTFQLRWERIIFCNLQEVCPLGKLLCPSLITSASP